MRVKMFIAIMVLLLVQTGQAEEAGYELLWSYETGGNFGSGVSISHDGSYIAAGSDDNVHLFNREGELLWSYKTGGNVMCVSISSDGSYIAAGSGWYDSKVYLFNREGELLWSCKTGGNVMFGGVYGVSISSDGSYIVAGYSDYNDDYSDDKVYLFNRDGELLWSYKISPTVGDVSISSDGSYIVARSRDNTGRYSCEDKAYIFNRAGELLYMIGDGVCDVYSVCDVSISSDCSYIAVGSRYNKVCLFNRAGELLWSYQADGDVCGVSISSDGSYIVAVSGKDDDKVYLFNREGELLWSYEAGGRVNDVSISSDGSYIAAGSLDGTVYLFNREGELLWSYEAGGRVNDVSISSDSSYIAARSSWVGNTVYLFASPEGLFDIIEDVKKSVELESAKNFNMAEVETLLSLAEDAFSTGDYAKASELADEAKDRTESIPNEASSAENIINEVESAISHENSKGFNMAEAETLLSNAKDAFGTGNYVKASELAGAAKANAESIANEASAAENAIAEVESVIQQDELKGFNPVAAEPLLSQAEEAFSTGEYTKASELADKAKDHALDIDQDGVSNDADFAPTINNYLIYAGATILLVVLVIAIITGLKAIPRFKLEREYKEARRREQEREERERLRQEAEERRKAERRKEQERIRAEEEKHRREEKEKQRLENRKQDIIRTIDKVINER
jgi:WD40 repeat protein